MVEIIVRKNERQTDLFLPSREECKRLEKEGNVFGRPDELRKIAENNRANYKRKLKEQHKKYVLEAFYNIKNGKSYIKERNKEVQNARKNEELVLEEISRQRRDAMGKSM